LRSQVLVLYYKLLVVLVAAQRHSVELGASVWAGVRDSESFLSEFEIKEELVIFEEGSDDGEVFEGEPVETMTSVSV
jgi:hypothetical protein